MNIGNRKKTTLSSRQACFVIAHSLGDLMIRIFKTIAYILLDYIVGENHIYIIPTFCSFVIIFNITCHSIYSMPSETHLISSCIFIT